MKVFLTLFLLLQMTVVLSTELRSTEKNWFHFEINNFKSPSYSLTLYEDAVLFQESYGDYGVPMNWCTSSYRVSEYKLLTNELEDIGVDDWNKYYVNPDYADGTEYKIAINIDGLSLNVIGSNKYPANFEKLLKLVNRLIKESSCEPSL